MMMMIYLKLYFVYFINKALWHGYKLLNRDSEEKSNISTYFSQHLQEPIGYTRPRNLHHSEIVYTQHIMISVFKIVNYTECVLIFSIVLFINVASNLLLNIFFAGAKRIGHFR